MNWVSLFDITSKKNELQELEEQTKSNEFWNDQENSSKVLQKIKLLKDKVINYEEQVKLMDDIHAMIELIEEMNEESMIDELKADVKKFSKGLDKLEVQSLLSGKHDVNNAIVTIHPGAGGTESQDWAEMLYRMYSKWSSKTGYSVNEVDFLEGDGAGIKSVTFEVIGENAYGYLRGEMGVHRLVRISPFDSNSRRHTSFASVEVLPEISDDVELDISPDDLRVDTYRASGAGGQHVNKTSSAVRLIHEPTGIVAECQTERSQVQNREYAMRLLKSRIYEIEKQKQDQELASERRSQVGAGDRSEKIRTYNYPQGRITDHRIGLSIYQMEDFLNGNLDEMIDAITAYDRAEKLTGKVTFRFLLM